MFFDAGYYQRSGVVQGVYYREYAKPNNEWNVKNVRVMPQGV